MFNDLPTGKDGVDSTSKTVVIIDTPAKEKSGKISKSDGGISMEKFVRDNKIMKGNMLNLITNPIFDLFVSYKTEKLI